MIDYLAQQDTDSLLRSIVRRYDSTLDIDHIFPLTPDASARRYYRVYCIGDPIRTVIAVLFYSVACPEAEGDTQIDSYEAYVQLSSYYKSVGFPVPELYYAERSESFLPVLLIEDLGDRCLAHTVLSPGRDSYSSLQIDYFYEKAIDEIIKLQTLAPAKGLFAYNRSFTKRLYVKEMYEFTDFLLAPFGLSATDTNIFKDLFDGLATELEGYTPALAHRDYHSWNIMIDPSDKMRVIDFQDSLLATPVYDIISLLNDRDTDAALGDRRYRMLVDYMRERSPGIPDFFVQFHRALLQRDLKVAGRFSKLASNGALAYSRWIPGTLRRIERTLATICGDTAVGSVAGEQRPYYLRSFNLLRNLLPEIYDRCC